MPRSVDSNAATGEAVDAASAAKPGGGAKTIEVLVKLDNSKLHDADGCTSLAVPQEAHGP